jgi:hypothetical protein
MEGKSMATTAEGQTPIHLWIVGILALLWNGIGCLDYTMTNLKNAAWLAQMTPDQMAYMDSLPGWLTGFWAIGVWGGLAGAILLLMRSRYAVWALALSCIGAVIGLGYQVTMANMPASMKAGPMAIMPYVIILITIFLLWYSWSMEKKGVLR